MTQDWNVNRLGERCTSCGRTFEVGEWVQTLLYACGDGYERRDYCPPCAGAAAAELQVGAWRARRPAPGPPKARPLDREAILEFFRRLESEAAPEKVEFRFVLALLLWRKKVLRLEDSRPVLPGGEDAPSPAVGGEGQDVWYFLHPADGTRHAVIRPEISDERVDRLSESLESLLAEMAAGANGASDPDSGAAPHSHSVEEPAGA